MAVRDMTRGNIVRQLVGYTIPLVLGNIFQLAYNAVDSMIAGRFIGAEALAATGMAGPVMNILILGISGICIGAGVLMSSFFGSGSIEKLKRELGTLLVSGTVFSVVLTALGVIFIEPLLTVLNVPESIHDMTATYLRVVFIGVPFTYFYNALSQALKSVGDSKTPLKFLMATSILNAALDLFFIGCLGFGIMCSALTTTVSEVLSALLCFIYIYRRVPVLSLRPRELRVDRGMLGATLSYGAVTALQQSVQPIGKVMIQGAVNTLGVATIAAYNAVTKIDDFAYTPEQNISHAMTTFIAQNRGAGNKERAYKGFVRGLVIETVYFVMLAAVVLALNRVIMHLFISGEGADAVVAEGERYLFVMAFLYVFPAFTNGIQGFFRGVGKMKTTLVGTCIQASLRVIFTFILVPYMGIVGICLACAIGWICMLAFQIPAYYHFKHRDLALRSREQAGAAEV